MFAAPYQRGGMIPGSSLGPCSVTLGLSGRSRERKLLVGKVQPSVFLDQAGLQCDDCNMQTEAVPGLNGDKLGGVILPCQTLERARQRSPGRTFLCQPKASSVIGAKHAQEVPAHPADHRIENRRRNLLYKLPALSHRLRERIQTFRQDAFPAQKNGMRFQALALFDAGDDCGLAEPIT